MTKPILILILLFSGCIWSDINTCHYIAREVQRDYYGTNLNCVSHADEIQRRCELEGIYPRQASFVSYHRALVVNGIVIDSSNAMTRFPVRLDELYNKTGYQLYKWR